MSPTAQRERELEVLADMEPQVRGLTAAHIEKRQLWFPADLMEPQDGEDPGDFRAAVRQHAADLSGPARATMILGLITEEGLPHFHKMVADHYARLGFVRGDDDDGSNGGGETVWHLDLATYVAPDLPMHITSSVA